MQEIFELINSYNTAGSVSVEVVEEGAGDEEGEEGQEAGEEAEAAEGQ